MGTRGYWTKHNGMTNDSDEELEILNNLVASSCRHIPSLSRDSCDQRQAFILSKIVVCTGSRPDIQAHSSNIINPINPFACLQRI